jgi:hypothetical protein
MLAGSHCCSRAEHPINRLALTPNAMSTSAFRRAIPTSLTATVAHTTLSLGGMVRKRRLEGPMGLSFWPTESCGNRERAARTQAVPAGGGNPAQRSEVAKRAAFRIAACSCCLRSVSS